MNKNFKLLSSRIILKNSESEAWKSALNFGELHMSQKKVFSNFFKELGLYVLCDDITNQNLLFFKTLLGLTNWLI